MAHWSKIGRDPPRKLLGNRVFALHLVLLSYSLSKRRKIQPKRRRLRRTSLVSAWPPTRLSRWRISGVSTLNLGLNLSQTPPICTYTGARNHTSSVCDRWPTITSRYLP